MTDEADSSVVLAKLQVALFKECTNQRLCSWGRRGWSGGAMVLGKLPVPGRPTIWMIVGQEPICAGSRCGWGWFGQFYSPLSFLSSFSFSLGDGPI